MKKELADGDDYVIGLVMPWCSVFLHFLRYTSPTDMMMSPITKGLLARTRRGGGVMLPTDKNQQKVQKNDAIADCSASAFSFSSNANLHFLGTWNFSIVFVCVNVITAADCADSRYALEGCGEFSEQVSNAVWWEDQHNLRGSKGV